MTVIIKLLKLSLFLIAFLILQFKLTTFIHASDNFNVDNYVIYEVETTGNTKVINNISIENLNSEIYAKQYIFKMDNFVPENIKVSQDNSLLDFQVNKKENGADILVFFENALTGKGKKRNFTISFDNPDLAVRTGEVWEISIPKTESLDLFSTYDLILKIPLSLGNEAYISPKPLEIEEYDEYKNYIYNLNQIQENGISAGFGKFQVFSFNLNYHLENNSSKRKEIEIAIPPDTSLQRVYYESIEPKPENVSVDIDGNWIASYTVNANKRVDVNVIGYVQIFANSRKFIVPPPVSLLSNTKPTEHWQTNHDAIRTLASELKTPRNIYDYVIQTLDYNSEGVNPNSERLGAVGALKSPGNSLCMEFTDLFIAISRAAGIPAREINGYAYTENSKIQPLSLVSDVLHSWPEYWDSDKSTWISIDPTWANTSGIDYFDKLDLRHFAFVIHGSNSVEPFPPGSYKLGDNPQKDIYVSFGQLPENSYSKVEIQSKLTRGVNILGNKYAIEIINTGSSAEYELTEEIIIDGEIKDKSFIQVLPPFANYKDTVSIKYGLFATKSPKNILIKAGSNQLNIPIDKNTIVFKQLIAICFIIIIFLILLYRKKVIKYPFKNHFRKS